MIQRGAYSPTTDLIAAAQTVTGSWVDLGLLTDTRGFNTIAVWFNLTINNTTGFRLRCIARHTETSSDDYLLPIATVSNANVQIQDEYFELVDNADQKLVVSCDIFNVIPWCQFQISAGTVGATGATVDTAKVSRGY